MNLSMGRIKGTVSVSAVMQYFFLFLIYISHGAVLYTLNSSQISIAIIVLCVVYIAFHRNMYKNFYVVHIIIFAALMGMLMLLHSQPYIMQVAFRIIESLLLLIVTYWIDKKQFINRFVKLTLFFAVVSLGFYFVQVIEPRTLQGVLKLQPPVTGWETSPFYGKWLYTYRGIYALYRNNGIFTEPGLYQMILNSALAIVLFFPELVSYSKTRYRTVIVILVITIITTSSTSGYMGLLIIIVGYMMKKNKSIYDKGLKKYTVLILIAAVIGVLWDYYIRANDSILYINVISKFEDIGVLENASGGARLSVIELCAGLFAQNPTKVLFGFGYSTISSVMAMSGTKTAGAFIFYFLTAAGLPVTIYLLYPYLIRPIKNKGYLIEIVVFILLYFNTSLAQSREAYPSLLLLPFVLAAINDRNDTLMD